MAKVNLFITVQKVFVFLVELLLAGGLAYLTDHPEWIFLAPVLEGIRNVIKTKFKSTQ